MPQHRKHKERQELNHEVTKRHEDTKKTRDAHFSADCVSGLCGLGVDFVGRAAANCRVKQNANVKTQGIQRRLALAFYFSRLRRSAQSRRAVCVSVLRICISPQDLESQL